MKIWMIPSISQLRSVNISFSLLSLEVSIDGCQKFLFFSKFSCQGDATTRAFHLGARDTRDMFHFLFAPQAYAKSSGAGSNFPSDSSCT